MTASTSHFSGPAGQRPCSQCHHYGGPLPSNTVNCFCRHPRLSPVVGQPEHGCAYWEREPGADDDQHQP